MIVYAESSAIAAWLLGERLGDGVRRALESAEHVVTSDLSGLEVHRALCRGMVQQRFGDAVVARMRAQLARSSARWIMMAIAPEVLQRAGMPFPDEPVRSLDAIHLATALAVRSEQPDLAMLSLDQRVRRNAVALGFQVLPA